MLTTLLLTLGCATESREDFGAAYGAAVCDYFARCGAIEADDLDHCAIDYTYDTASCTTWNGGLAAECLAAFEDLECSESAPDACQAACYGE